MISVLEGGGVEKIRWMYVGGGLPIGGRREVKDMEEKEGWGGGE